MDQFRDPVSIYVPDNDSDRALYPAPAGTARPGVRAQCATVIAAASRLTRFLRITRAEPRPSPKERDIRKHAIVGAFPCPHGVECQR